MTSSFRLMIVLAASSCGSPDVIPKADPTNEVNEVVAPARASVAPVLSTSDKLRVCKGGASFRNGVELHRVKARKASEGLVRISYVRKDGRSFAYDCRVDGNQVRYRMIDEAGPGTGPGAWSGRGSKTTFEIRPGEIEFTDDFLDGSTDTERLKI